MQSLATRFAIVTLLGLVFMGDMIGDLPSSTDRYSFGDVLLTAAIFAGLYTGGYWEGRQDS